MIFQLVLRKFPTSIGLNLVVREDDGTIVESSSNPLNPEFSGWIRLGLGWSASGWLEEVYSGAILTGFDTGLVDRVRWGVVGGDVSSSSGSLLMDDFFSHHEN